MRAVSLTSVFFALVGILATSPYAGADTIAIPNAFATTPGTTGLNTLVRDLGNPRTYQMIISATNLASIPAGSQLTGVQWRSFITAQNPLTWPPANYSYTDYNMWIAPAALPVGAMSTTFANNVGAGEVQVFDGPLTIPANSFTQGVTPNASPWGALISFTTPYTYNGGDIVFTARHPGATSAGTLFLDAITAAVGLANGVQTMTAVGDTAATGAAATPIIFQFTYTVPGPSALALLGLAGLTGSRRRRRD